MLDSANIPITPSVVLVVPLAVTWAVIFLAALAPTDNIMSNRDMMQIEMYKQQKASYKLELKIYEAVINKK